MKFLGCFGIERPRNLSLFVINRYGLIRSAHSQGRLHYVPRVSFVVAEISRRENATRCHRTHLEQKRTNMIGFRRNGRTIVISCETTRSNHKRVRIFNNYIQTARCSNSDVKFKFFPNRYQLITFPFTTLLTNNFTQFLPTLDNDRVRSITSNVRRVILLVLEKISKKKMNIQQERINNKYTRVYVYICEMPRLFFSIVTDEKYSPGRGHDVALYRSPKEI